MGGGNYMYSEEMGKPFVNLVQGKADAAAAPSVRSFASLCYLSGKGCLFNSG